MFHYFVNSSVNNKQYSLLLQDDLDSTDPIGEYDEKMIILEDEEEDEGFKAIIGDGDDDNDDNDPEEYDDEYVDSDEEEIYSSNQHRQLSNEGLALNSQVYYSRKNDYRLLTNSDMDTKSFDAPLSTVWTPTPMSPARRACFIASIMFGVLVVAMFMWALPCDVEPCEGESKLGSRQWFTHINNIGVNYSNLLTVFPFGSFQGIILGYYGVNNISEILSNDTLDIWCNEGESSKDSNGAEAPCAMKNEQSFDLSLTPCGLLLLSIDTGEEQWRNSLYECHSRIKCDLLDVTGDGIADCLVLGHKSMAVMIEPTKGLIFWRVHAHASEEIDMRDFQFDVPLLIKDINSDGILELLFHAVKLKPSHSSNEGNSHLILVSGQTGEVIGKPFLISHCLKIKEIFSEGDSIGYSCSMEDGSDLAGSIPLTNLLNEIFGPSLLRELISNDSLLMFPEKLSPLHNDKNEAVCQIKYINRGKCPYCRSKLQLGMSVDSPLIYDDTDYKSVVSWEVISHSNICKGAILKLWKWDPITLGGLSTPMTEEENLQDTKERNTRFDSSHSSDTLENADSALYDSNPYSETEKDSANLDGGSIYDTYRNPYEKPTEEFLDQTHGYSDKNIYQSSSKDDVGISGGRISDTPTKGTAVFETLTQIRSTFSFLPPTGLKMHKIEEIVILLIFNGSDWVSKELGSLVIYQLCQEQSCLPSHESQRNSILIDGESLGGKNWNIYVTSSTFEEVKDSYRNDTSTLLMKSLTRKIVTEVGF